MRVLNVGGGASRELPARYDGWEQHLLDVDPETKPDICADAREMNVEGYDAVYSSHCLEHFYRHDVPLVLGNFRRALVVGGIVDLIVPNIQHLLQDMAQRGLDIMDTYYRVPSGAISYHDVLYGWNRAMSGGNLYYAHKCAFTPASLGEALQEAGFRDIQLADMAHNLGARATR